MQTIKGVSFITLCFALMSWPFLLFGCSSPPAPPVIVSGHLVEVRSVPEDSVWTGLFLEFADGRLQKARLHYRNPVMFHLDKYNEITMDETGTVQKVECKEGIND